MIRSRQIAFVRRQGKSNAHGKDKSYLVATFDGFPGVRIPLLSAEECAERGIEPGRFPPFETWTPKQQEAGRKLAECLAEMAVLQAYRSIANELDRMVAEGYDKSDFEKEAARRILARIHAGKWKPPDKHDTYGLEREVGWVLEPILKSEANWPMSLADE